MSESPLKRSGRPAATNPVPGTGFVTTEVF